MTTTNPHNNFLKAEYCLKAFQRSEPVDFFCCEEVDGGRDEEGDESDSDSLGGENEGADDLLPACRFTDYAAQVVGLKDNLRPLLQKIKDCRKRKRLFAHQVENTKMSTAQISQQISKIRLSMFTRRVLYRQNLISKAEEEKQQQNNAEMKAEKEPEEEPEKEQRNGRCSAKGTQESTLPSTNSNEKVTKESSPGKPATNVTATATDSPPDIPMDPQPSTRRKSTRAAVVATTASSQSLSSNRSKRKKDDVSKEEEDEAPAPSPPAPVPATATATATAKSAKSANSQNSTSSSSTSLKRNPKRSRR